MIKYRGRRLKKWVYLVIAAFIVITLNLIVNHVRVSKTSDNLIAEAPQATLNITYNKPQPKEYKIDNKIHVIEYIPKEVEKQEVSKQEADNTYEGLNKYDFELLCAIVRQEAGPDYQSALAVMSSLNNRLNDPRWSWCGSTIMEQATAEGQYCYSIDDLWKKYLNGNVEEEVKEAVLDGLRGKTNHEYNSFRGYYIEDCLEIGGNWYFNSW